MAVKTKDNGANGARSSAAIFKALDDKMWKPGGGCSSPLDYMEQSSWLLFLRYLDAREEDRRMECELRGDPYEPALPKPLRWSSLAWPTRPDGSFDYDRAPKGQELIGFVNDTLFPGLEALKDRGSRIREHRRGRGILLLNPAQDIRGVTTAARSPRDSRRPGAADTKAMSSNSQQKPKAESLRRAPAGRDITA